MKTGPGWGLSGHIKVLPDQEDPRTPYRNALERESRALGAVMQAERELSNRQREYETLRKKRISLESADSGTAVDGESVR